MSIGRTIFYTLARRLGSERAINRSVNPLYSHASRFPSSFAKINEKQSVAIMAWELHLKNIACSLSHFKTSSGQNRDSIWGAMKHMITALAGFGFLLFSIAGHSTIVKASYSVDANAADPGFKIQTAGVVDNPFTFDLAIGSHYTFDLFRIWTDETAVNEDDDTASKPISVHFNFLLPAVFAGEVDGGTDGYRDSEHFFGFEVSEFYQGGELAWNAPADLFFSPQNSGHLLVALSNNGIFQSFLSLLRFQMRRIGSVGDS